MLEKVTLKRRRQYFFRRRQRGAERRVDLILTETDVLHRLYRDPVFSPEHQR